MGKKKKKNADKYKNKSSNMLNKTKKEEWNSRIQNVAIFYSKLEEKWEIYLEIFVLFLKGNHRYNGLRFRNKNSSFVVHNQTTEGREVWIGQ